MPHARALAVTWAQFDSGAVAAQLSVLKMWSFPTDVTSDGYGASLSRRPPCTTSVVIKDKKRTPRKPRRNTTRNFRATRDSKLYNLTLDVNALQQEIHSLMIRRQLLHTRALYESRLLADSSVSRTVIHYFKGFAHGYRGPQADWCHDGFVRSIAGVNFSLGVTGLGVDMLLEQWRRYTELFRLNETAVRSIEILALSESSDEDSGSAAVIVKCVAGLKGVFTREAVKMVFPHVLHDSQSLRRVLGQKVSIPMVLLLYFDSRGRLVRHDADADFFSAVRGALGGDSNAAARFVGALRVGQESMVGPICEPTENGADAYPRDGEAVGRDIEDTDGAAEETAAGGSGGGNATSPCHEVAFLLSSREPWKRLAG